MNGLVMRVKKLEERKEVGKGEGEIQEGVRRMERVMEREEREKRITNLVFKGVKAEKGEGKEWKGYIRNLE